MHSTRKQGIKSAGSDTDPVGLLSSCGFVAGIVAFSPNAVLSVHSSNDGISMEIPRGHFHCRNCALKSLLCTLRPSNVLDCARLTVLAWLCLLDCACCMYLHVRFGWFVSQNNHFTISLSITILHFWSSNPCENKNYQCEAITKWSICRSSCCA